MITETGIQNKSYIVPLAQLHGQEAMSNSLRPSDVYMHR